MGDSANGKKLFTKMCASCHTVEKDGKHKVTGPNLHGVMGKVCGSKYKIFEIVIRIRRKLGESLSIVSIINIQLIITNKSY